MKNMFFFFIIIISLIYLALLYIIWNICKIRNKTFNKETALLPLIPTSILLSFFLLFFFISNWTYSIIYFIIMSLFAFLIYTVFFCAIHQIISCFTSKLKPIFRYGIIFVLPFSLWLFGIVWARITHYDEITLKYKGFNGSFKIAHLSDIHLGVIYKSGFVASIVEDLNKINPDIVVITGDLMDGSIAIENWLEPFSKSKAPIYFITGNHESYYGKEAALAKIKNSSLIYIGNDVIDIGKVNLIGVDYEYLNITERLENIKHLFINSQKPNILLYHKPNLTPKELTPYNIFLFLAGHTHGGQMFPMQMITYFECKCFTGLYSYEKNHVYVSTGVGTALCPLRVASSSVIGVINIVGE